MDETLEPVFQQLPSAVGDAADHGLGVQQSLSLGIVVTTVVGVALHQMVKGGEDGLRRGLAEIVGLYHVLHQGKGPAVLGKQLH